MKDREIIVAQLKDAEAFWEQQKMLMSRGIFDRPTIAVAMELLNSIHYKAMSLGHRDLLEKKEDKITKKKEHIFWD